MIAMLSITWLMSSWTTRPGMSTEDRGGPAHVPSPPRAETRTGARCASRNAVAASIAAAVTATDAITIAAPKSADTNAAAAATVVTATAAAPPPLPEWRWHVHHPRRPGLPRLRIPLSPPTVVLHTPGRDAFPPCRCHSTILNPPTGAQKDFLSVLQTAGDAKVFDFGCPSSSPRSALDMDASVASGRSIDPDAVQSRRVLVVDM